MNKKIGIIIGVVVAVVAIILGVVFLGPDKDVSVDDPTENITDVMNQDEVADVTEEITETEEATEESTEEATKAEESEYIPEGPGIGAPQKPNIMDETIYLGSANLKKYGISTGCEISQPYPTLLGCVYLVRDYNDDSSKTYLFVTTQKDIVCEDLDFELPSVISLADSYMIKTVDLDGEAGEEIILNLFNGGQGGAGGYNSYIFKIAKNKLVEMKQPDGVYEETGFTANLRAPYEIVVTNKYNDEECVISAKGNEEHERFFDAKGNPDGSCELACDSFFTFEPIELEDGSYGVRRLQYSYIGSHANCLGYAETVIKYNANKKAFEVISANFGHPDVFVETFGYSEYAYCDINEDGVDEFIIHTGASEGDRTYDVYTYDENRLVYVGAIEGWHATLYDGKKTITMAAQTSGEGFYYTYEMKNNRLKLVEKGDYTLDGNSSTLKNVGKAIEFKEY